VLLCVIVLDPGDLIIFYTLTGAGCEYCVAKPLVGLKRTEEAIREAERFAAEEREVFSGEAAIHVVLAHAASGDVDKTIAAAAKAGSRDRYFIEDCYADADLGRCYAAKPLASFASVFPSPRSVPAVRCCLWTEGGGFSVVNVSTLSITSCVVSGNEADNELSDGGYIELGSDFSKTTCIIDDSILNENL
jgi:hypothetical protein